MNVMRGRRNRLLWMMIWVLLLWVVWGAIIGRRGWRRSYPLGAGGEDGEEGWGCLNVTDVKSLSTAALAAESVTTIRVEEMGAVVTEESTTLDSSSANEQKHTSSDIIIASENELAWPKTNLMVSASPLEEVTTVETSNGSFATDAVDSAERLTSGDWEWESTASTSVGELLVTSIRDDTLTVALDTSILETRQMQTGHFCCGDMGTGRERSYSHCDDDYAYGRIS
ncbi:hypothetical protein BC829DRAFT_429464 [Chytridium lagenaria]|nr:hypothetical protein BC829DRAFT_429464 [Chytridium lagenaria]